MTDPRSPQAAALDPSTAGDAQREERHQRLATLLGAFADGELPAETVSQIDAHLLGCRRCRQEVQVHRAIRGRLEREPLPAASMALRDRIVASIAAAPAPQWESVAATVPAVADASTTATPPAAWHRTNAPWLLIAVLAVVVALVGIFERNTNEGEARVQVSAVPLMSAALADYRRVMQGDLPGRGRDLAAIRQSVSFPVQPLEAPGLSLLAAWTTSLNGEPAAVLAYRTDDHVMLQYVVSELQLYRPADLRNAFAGKRILAAHDGQQSVVVWPETSAGSVLIADLSLNRIESFHRAASDR
jgi:anti-sigma factor RsiW